MTKTLTAYLKITPTRLAQLAGISFNRAKIFREKFLIGEIDTSLLKKITYHKTEVI